MRLNQASLFCLRDRRTSAPTSFSTSAWNGVGVVITVKVGASGRLGTRMVLAAMVPRLESNVAKLCTGQPSAVYLVKDLARACGERTAGLTGESPR